MRCPICNTLLVRVFGKDCLHDYRPCPCLRTAPGVEESGSAREAASKRCAQWLVDHGYGRGKSAGNG